MAFDTFDTDSVATAGVTFSNGGLTALGGSGFTTALSGVVQSIEGKKAGKWYVEFTCVAVAGGANNDAVAVVPAVGMKANPGSVLAGIQDQGWGYYSTSGTIVHAASNQTNVNATTWGAGDVIGVAIDLDNSAIWFNKNGGAWVGTSGTPNPATNTAGFSIATMHPSQSRVYPAVSLSGATSKFTANFGASAFTGTVPSGFNAGWTNATNGTFFGTFSAGGPRGNASNTSSLSTPPQNNKAVSPYVSTLTGSVTSVSVPFGAGSSDQKAVIYDSSGAGGLPGALLGVSTNTVTAGSNGEQSFTFTGVNVVSGTTYWFGVVSDSVVNSSQNITIGPGLTNGTAFNSGTYASPTNPFGAAPSTANFRLPLIINVTPAVATKKPSNRSIPVSVYRTSTGLIYRFKIYDSTKSDGSGLTGLVFNSAGLKCSYSADGAAATAVTLVTATIGTWTSAGFKEVDATNLPGWYEFGIPNAALSATGQRVQLMFWGATNMYQVDKDIDLVANNPQVANLPNVAIGSAGSLPTADASGRVTVISNVDKSGYSLTQAFPANFSSMTISGGGSVTAGTVSDKTGYALTAGEHTAIAADAQTGLTAQGYTTTRAPKLDNLDATVSSRVAPAALPANFSTLAIDGSGFVSVNNISSIVYGVWDEQTSAHLVPGSFAAELAQAVQNASNWTRVL